MINSFILNTNQLILYGYCNEKIDVDKDSSLSEEAIFVHLQEELFKKKSLFTTISLSNFSFCNTTGFQIGPILIPISYIFLTR